MVLWDALVCETRWSVRRVGLVVSCGARNHKVLGSRPGSAALSARNILGQDIHSHRLRSTKPFIPPGSINLVPASAGVKAGNCTSAVAPDKTMVALYKNMCFPVALRTVDEMLYSIHYFTLHFNVNNNDDVYCRK